jgi:membrane protein implicated in regulation of membrane protease activity
MLLIIYYIGLMIVGDFSAYFIGLLTERAFGSQVSLIVFLTLYFLFLWVAWLIAVRLTEPRQEPKQATTA